MPAEGEGLGKGKSEEARAGAIFEALEHYLCGPAGFVPEETVLCEAAELVSGPLEADPAMALLDEVGTSSLPCYRFESLTDQRELAVPLVLTSPWYAEGYSSDVRASLGDDSDYTELMRYSSNSGSAIGVSAAEALLHALNEVIERDAFSLFLVRTFFDSGGTIPHVIDPSLLFSEAAAVHRLAEEINQAPVYLIDITSDLGVPTMLAYTPGQVGRSYRRGAGTSLNAAYAVWRALTELVQTSLFSPGDEGQPSLEGLRRHPTLHACGSLDLEEMLDGVRVVPPPTAEASPEKPKYQLDRLIERLEHAGFAAYWRTIGVLDGGVTAAQVVVPGLEKFMLVCAGNLVVPGARARDVLRNLAASP